MNSAMRLFPVIIIGLFFTYCSGGTTKSIRGFRKNMGDHLRDDIIDQSTKLFFKHGFEVERQEGVEGETSGDVFIETKWKDRLPFDEEKADGIVAARTKIIIRARITQKALNFTSNQRMFKVSYTMENEFMVGLDREWVRRPLCSRLDAYCRRVYDEYKSQLRFAKGD